MDFQIIREWRYMSANKTPLVIQPTVIKDKLQELGAFGPVIGCESDIVPGSLYLQL